MKSLSVAGVLALALALGSAPALAQTGPHVGDGSNSVTPPYPYNAGAGAAHVGDGSNSTTPPYPYNVGSGAAHVGDGSNSTQPPYQYSVAGGASGADARKNYVAGRTQSLEPPSGMAQAEKAENQNRSK